MSKSMIMLGPSPASSRRFRSSRSPLNALSGAERPSRAGTGRRYSRQYGAVRPQNENEPHVPKGSKESCFRSTW